jgi:hypothetical protein
MDTQTWPADAKHPWMAPYTAASRSASASTIIGFLPPSSSEHPIKRSAACRATSLPVRVLPVNIMKSTRSPSAGPSSGPSPVTMPNTSGGRPAWRSRSTAQSAVKLVCTSGFSTVALPAISAGAASVTARLSG